MLTIDAQARSPIWDDLKQGRTTEIDAPQDAVLHPADRFGRRVPLSTRMRDLIKSVEQGRARPPGLSLREIRR